MKLAVFASVAYDAVPNNDPINPSLESILPVITIDPEISIDPVKTSDPDITTA